MVVSWGLIEGCGAPGDQTPATSRSAFTLAPGETCPASSQTASLTKLDVATPLDGLARWTNRFVDLGPDFFTELPPRACPTRTGWRSEACAQLLGLPDWAARPGRTLAGLQRQCALAGMRPLASVYSGHQFGVWAGQLGDGRAHWLGEVAHAQWPDGGAAQGRRPHALLAHGRRPRRAALVDPRVPVLRSDGRLGHADHAGAVHHRLARCRCAAKDRDRRRRDAGGTELHPLRPLRALRHTAATSTRCASWPTSSSTHHCPECRDAPAAPSRCSKRWRAAPPS
jgi:hypothetical protein